MQVEGGGGASVEEIVARVEGWMPAPPWHLAEGDAVFVLGEPLREGLQLGVE